MSAEIPREPEWRGQKWEYLTFYLGRVGGGVDVGLNIDHLTKYTPLGLYANELEGTAEKKFVPFGKFLNILGAHGWKLVHALGNDNGTPLYFFFERPAATPE